MSVKAKEAFSVALAGQGQRSPHPGVDRFRFSATQAEAVVKEQINPVGYLFIFPPGRITWCRTIRVC